MKSLRVLAILSLLSSAGQACDYVLKSSELLQCRPIKLMGGPEPGEEPKWTYITDTMDSDGVLAHIYCTCQTALQHADASCESEQTRKLTFTLPTHDILQTCSQKDALCQAPCQQLVAHSPSQSQ